MKNRYFLVTLLTFLAAADSRATCVAICTDSDNGVNGSIPGTVELRQSCSPPGGPVHTTVETMKDYCQGPKSLIEFSCSGMPGAQSASANEIQCAKGCRIRDGQAYCDDGAAPCVVPDCAAPPPNCHYMNPTVENGCPTGCGTLVCSPAGEETTICPDQPCAAPPKNCHYGKPVLVNGCPVGCGPLLCDGPLVKKPKTVR